MLFACRLLDYVSHPIGSRTLQVTLCVILDPPGNPAAKKKCRQTKNACLESRQNYDRYYTSNIQRLYSRFAATEI
jgi:hypothetical protein